MKNQKYSVESEMVHADQPENDPFGSHVMPIYQTSTFKFNSVEDGRKFFAHEEGGGSHAYSRLGNPTVDRLEQAFATMEGENISSEVGALAFGSGMAAVSTALLALANGGSVVAQPALYGCTGQFLKDEAPELGINTHFVDLNNLEAVEQVLGENPDVKVIYGETMANPTMTVLNIPAVAEIAKTHNVLFLVDNTFATPYHLRPLELGADMVLHSTTKYLNGHGTLIGGALIAEQSLIDAHNVALFRKNLGGVTSPFDAWLNLNGLKTFTLRMQQHAKNGVKVAEYLDQHEAIEKVYYPGLSSDSEHELADELFEKGFGGVMSFELKGGFEAGVSMMNKVEFCTLAVSLGTVDTLIQHPASMTHSVMDPEIREQAGITDGLVRLAVGIENVDDIIGDLEQALKALKAVMA
ncbi:trans-sulfuration enzyme family protein [Fodinibius saliphilus]|uniref:trans-sulfuration enzyme family protein n=1 Tax=Fodinibius saliphilus TaxID=1920650 RepID=UPI0011090359|nr:aminotransferase class I/II-fold pyridoxal phosphate-dependent enzyme [Fodinibius saliphilus]